MARRQRRERGGLEEEILACLAASSEPMAPSEVQAALGDTLAYTTVMTTLSRMYDKRALNREQRGRAYAYSLTDTPDVARASMTAFNMRRLLDTQDDRAGVLAQFVGNLEPDDEQLLKELLR
ncbi:BlaI/MecI/CopY family transcriptional regulator, partial [uncultured Jatrophihabitans sp.]|uniref:BlaI/MecI/CopY family transcriptional regulator n=1 Tax=uncultured Jatrophihabitans sp. TaxID=1610747 RepID=UPI0035CA0CE0